LIELETLKEVEKMDMKEGILPVVTLSTDIPSAIDRLKTANRSAVLAKAVNGEFFLFSAGTLATARSKQMETIADLDPDLKIKAPEKELQAFGAHSVTPGFSGSLQIELPDFVIGEIEHGVAKVLIRDKGIADTLFTGPHSYYCDGPRHHSFAPGAVSVGDPCPRGDGYTIVST
jgi:hypothetical protein